MPDSPTTEPAHEELRVDDLARAAGVTTTTIRLYQSKGLLPAPRLVGRTGYYGPAHLERLRVIGRLQDRGFSLAGIAALLELWERGGGLGHLVGADAQLGSLLGRRQQMVMDGAELLERFPQGTMTPELVQRAATLGLVEVTDDGQFRLPDVRFVESGAELARLGVPLSRILDEWEAVSTMTDDVAARFADLFEQAILPSGWRDHLDAQQIAELGETLGQLRALSEQVLLAALDDSIARTAAVRFAELLPD